MSTNSTLFYLFVKGVNGSSYPQIFFYKKKLWYSRCMRTFIIGSILALGALLPLFASADCVLSSGDNSSPTGSENVTDYGAWSSAIGTTASCTGDVSQVTISAKTPGTPPSYDLGIFEDASGAPGTQVGGWSVSQSQSLTGSCADVSYDFGSPVGVVSGARYWVVWRAASHATYPDIGVACVGTAGNSGDYRQSSDGSTWSGADSGSFYILADVIASTSTEATSTPFQYATTTCSTVGGLTTCVSKFSALFTQDAGDIKYMLGWILFAVWLGVVGLLWNQIKDLYGRRYDK